MVGCSLAFHNILYLIMAQKKYSDDEPSSSLSIQFSTVNNDVE